MTYVEVTRFLLPLSIRSTALEAEARPTTTTTTFHQEIAITESSSLGSLLEHGRFRRKNLQVLETGSGDDLGGGRAAFQR